MFLGRQIMPEPTLSLPKAPVLGYFSSISSPTRVRVIAAGALFWLAVVHLDLAGLVFLIASWDIWQHAREYSFGRFGFAFYTPLIPSLENFRDALQYDTGYLEPFYFVPALAPALLLFLVAAPVRRGRRIPTFLARLYLVPLTILITILTAIGTGAVLVFALGIPTRPEPGFLPWLLLLPLPVLFILLLNDLCSFLNWIARQPTAEKPPVSFLPAGHLRAATPKNPPA
jgi:hypothetical protein